MSWTSGLAEGLLVCALCAVPTLAAILWDCLPENVRGYLRMMTKASLALLALVTTAEAGPFRRACVRCAPAVQVVAQQVAVPVAPVAFVLAPTSQPSSYGAPPYRPPLRDPARSQPSATGSTQGLADLTRVISALVDRVEALERNFGAPGAGAPQIPQIVSQQCGKCHGENGGESGVTFADISGPMNDRAQLEVIKGTMPKRSDEAEPIAPEIRQALVAALEKMRR